MSYIVRENCERSSYFPAASDFIDHKQWHFRQRYLFCRKLPKFQKGILNGIPIIKWANIYGTLRLVQWPREYIDIHRISQEILIIIKISTSNTRTRTKDKQIATKSIQLSSFSISIFPFYWAGVLRMLRAQTNAENCSSTIDFISFEPHSSSPSSTFPRKAYGERTFFAFSLFLFQRLRMISGWLLIFVFCVCGLVYQLRFNQIAICLCFEKKSSLSA